MNTNNKKTLLVVAVCSFFTASAAQATNGYFSDGTGAKSRGMGGAGVAIAQEAGSMATNPAATVNMDPRLDVGVGIFSPKPRTYTIAGNDIGLNSADESDSNYFPIPFYGQNFQIDSSSSWGITMTALGGMNTNFKTNPFDATHPTGGTFGALGVDLKQVTLSGLYARQVNSQFSVGISLGVTYQMFQARGLGPFGLLSLDSTKLTNSSGHDTSSGIALKLGATYKVNNDVSIGFAYAPETDMSEFKEYAGLFAESGDFDIPSNYILGVAWQASPKVLVAADYFQINYTDVASVSNDAQRLTDITGGPGTSCATTNPATGAGSQFCLGGSQGAGFGWDDIAVFKVGVAYEQSSDMTLRVGLNHGESPIKTEDAVINIIAPATVEDHLTLGMTRKLSSSTEITVDFIHTFANSVTGTIPLSFSTAAGGNPTPSPGTATIEMEQNFIEVQYGMKF